MRKPAPRMPDNVKRYLKGTEARLHTLNADGWSVELTELYELVGDAQSRTAYDRTRELRPTLS